MIFCEGTYTSTFAIVRCHQFWIQMKAVSHLSYHLIECELSITIIHILALTDFFLRSTNMKYSEDVAFPKIFFSKYGTFSLLLFFRTAKHNFSDSTWQAEREEFVTSALDPILCQWRCVRLCRLRHLEVDLVNLSGFSTCDIKLNVLSHSTYPTVTHKSAIRAF